MSQTVSLPPPRRPESRPTYDKGTRNAVLAVMCLALVMVVANVSMLNVGIREISLDLGASSTQLHWIVDSYALVFAALLLPAGALGDRYGRRTLMLAGMAVMFAGSVTAALAGDPNVLIAGRAIAGVGAALVMPGTLSTITHVFPPSERGKAVGVWAGFASAGGIIGLLMGGGLLEGFAWESLFWTICGVAVLSFIATVMIAPNSKDPDEAHLDPFGAFLSILGVGGLVFAIIEGPAEGWGSVPVVAGFVSAAVGIGMFVWWELRTDRPILDVRLFANRAFGSGSVSITIQFFAAFGFFYVGLLYVQTILGYGAFKSAAALLPLGVLVVPMSAIAPSMARRFGLKVVGVVGLLLIGGGFAIMATLDAGSGYGMFLVALLVFGSGLGLATSPASESIVNALPPSKQGVASAVNDTARELGGALGIAIIGTAFTSGYENSIDLSGLALPPEVAAAATSSPLAGPELAAQIPDSDLADRFLDVTSNAFMDGFGSGVTIAAAAAVVGAIFVASRSPKHVSQPLDDSLIDADATSDSRRRKQPST